MISKMWKVEYFQRHVVTLEPVGVRYVLIPADSKVQAIAIACEMMNNTYAIITKVTPYEEAV